MIISLGSMALVLATLGQAETDAAASDAAHKGQLKYLKERAVELTLFMGANSKMPLPLTPQPVKYYTNFTGLSSVGATFLWLDGELPVAAVSFSIRRRPANAVYRESSSLCGMPLACRQGDATVWAPKSGGLLAQKFKDAPAPAESKAQRLTQMRNLARRFSVTWHHSTTEDKTQLRLSPAPLYRYESEKHAVVDGALFAFVATDDPEMLLLIEAARDAASKENHWRYSLARMSSLKEVVRLDEQEIWSVPNYHQDPLVDRMAGPYTEQKVGTYVPAADGPGSDMP
jgi:hypothetical protein